MEEFGTEEGTLKFAENAVASKGISKKHFRKFHGLTLSSLGVGTYLGSLDSHTDELVESALKQSILTGAINVIDTAINYRFQKSERCVGRAIRALIQKDILDREQIFVST